MSRRRHVKNYAAAQRVEAAHSSTGPAAAGPSTTSLEPDAFDLHRVSELPKERQQRGAPKLPAAVQNRGVLIVNVHDAYAQRPGLPESSVPGRSALETMFNSTTVISAAIHDTAAFIDGFASYADSPMPFTKVPVDDKSRHHRRRVAQHFKWRDTVIPSVVSSYLERKYGTTVQDAQYLKCDCSNVRQLAVALADWEGLTHIRLSICPCTPAVEQLLFRGYFACAPVRPSLAFSIKMLEFMSIHALNVAPNVTAWAATLQQYWSRRGQAAEYGDTFRKRLATALHWFQVLDNRAEVAVSQHVQRGTLGVKRRLDPQDGERRAAKRMRPQVPSGDKCDGQDYSAGHGASGNAGAATESPSAHEEPADDNAVMHAAPASRPKRGRTTVEDVEDDESTTASSSHPGSVRRVSGRVTRSTRAAEAGRTTRNSGVEDEAAVDAQSDAQACDATALPTTKITRPSAELRRKCPLCFGGPRPDLLHSLAHVLVCLDANFAQRRRKSAETDGVIAYAGSRFASQSELDGMEQEVDKKRARKPRKRTKGTSARVADEILDECENSFTAAHEKMTKASKSYYADTGLMALLCRHDRVLFVANMTTPGERQFYALALLRKLMRELPEDWTVGVLYDIACQISRSMEKFGFLEEFVDRFVFGVSVFHAYGHHWACQLVFHPRKREGFGLTDGEGCERFWSAIRRLIPGLRVTGFHRRLFVLDRQIDAIQSESVWKFGRWLARRYDDASARLAAVEILLDRSAVPREELAQEWNAQVTTQLAKPARQSVNAADKMINDLLLAMGSLQEQRQELKDQRARLKKVHTMTSSEVTTITSRIESLKNEISATETTISNYEASLGRTAKAKWKSMRGDAYLRCRVNARAVRAAIRSTLISYKFEHRKVERTFRHQLMQEKEHAQTRDLIHRREKNLAAQVRKFNALVDQMTELKRQGKTPSKRTCLPRRLDSRKLFKLDVDDDIWQEDPGLGPQDEGSLPRWQTDENVKAGIVSLLEERRCREEVERVRVEIIALGEWWKEERAALAAFVSDTSEPSIICAAVKYRLQRHDTLLERWTHDLRGRDLSQNLPSAAVKADADVHVALEGAHDVVEDAVGYDGEESEDEYDDRSSAYTSSLRDEDEAVAEFLDDMAALEAEDGDDAEATVCGDDAKEQAVSLVDGIALQSSAGPVPTPLPATVNGLPASDNESIDNEEYEEEPHSDHDQSDTEPDSDDAQDMHDVSEMHDTLSTRDARSERDADQTFNARNEDPHHTPVARNEKHNTTHLCDAGNNERDAAALPEQRNRITDERSTPPTSKPKKRKIKSYNVRRWRSGRFYCDKEDFARLISDNRWLTGDLLAVFAAERLKLANAQRVAVLHPVVLQEIESLADGLEAGQPQSAERARKCVTWELDKTLHPSDAVKWLIPAHVPSPLHWTLVEIRWDTRTVRFFDSFSMRGGYALLVERRVRALLAFCYDFFSLGSMHTDWTWVGEKRRSRQSNGYDCGPFVAADLTCLLTSDAPSTKSQAEMRAWRGEMRETLCGLENVETVYKDFTVRVREDQAAIEISD